MTIYIKNSITMYISLYLCVFFALKKCVLYIVYTLHRIVIYIFWSACAECGCALMKRLNLRCVEERKKINNYEIPLYKIKSDIFMFKISIIGIF